MACGSAPGELLLPMVCYKATNLHHGWTDGGPARRKYAVLKSGWFVMSTFGKWFEEVFVVNVKRRVGKKLLIGDNLASPFHRK